MDDITRISQQLGDLARRVADHDVTLAQQVTLGAKVDQISELVADLEVKVGKEEGKGYKPWKNPRWWDLGPDRWDTEISRIRGWYEDIAKRFLNCEGLPVCVLEHEVSVFILDAACEAWKSLWIPERRSVPMAAAQCEYLIRIWPGIRDQLTKALASCDHRTMGVKINGSAR